MNQPKIDIAPGVCATKWHGLNLDEPESDDWDKAIGIFKARITERYIEPVQLLLDTEKNKSAKDRKYGFTIVAIDSLLIETLWAFKQGRKDTKSNSRRAFKELLTSEDEFGFTEEQATCFYEDYRCGILHQAEIGNNSKVWSIGNFIIETIDSHIVINRTAFHDALVNCYEVYCGQLAHRNNTELRCRFRVKMDYISRVSHYD